MLPFLMPKLVKNYALFCIATILLFIFSFAYTTYKKPSYSFSEDSMEGIAYFSLSNIKTHSSPFQRSYLYEGTIRHFTTLDQRQASKLPCKIFLPIKQERPLGNGDYLVQGTLYKKGAAPFVFKPYPASAWQKVPSSFSLAEWRMQAKEGLRHFLKRKIHHEKVCAFFSAMATGEINERTLSLEFGKLGLPHILAISGFHFGLLAVFCGFFLRLFLSPKSAAIVLIFLLSGYFLFIGGAPSVQRAWIANTLFMCAPFFHRRARALNTLGIGLITAIFIDPLVICHLGFQLSFLCTAAILFLYPITEKTCEIVFPKRTLKMASCMPMAHQYAYLLSVFFRKAIALTLAVHVVAIPVVLFLFHKFPLLSLVYNLFFPFWITISLFLFLLAVLIGLPLPILGDLLHRFNTGFTSYLLDLAANPPAAFEFFLRDQNISLTFLVLYIFVIFTLSIVAQTPRMQNNPQSAEIKELHKSRSLT